MVRKFQRFIGKYSVNAATWMPGGSIPVVGDTFRLPALARTLERMIDADETASTANGRLAGLAAVDELFYCGDIADEMVAHIRNEGGWLTHKDLKQHRCQIEPSVTTRLDCGVVHNCGFWSQGPALGLALKIFEQHKGRHARYGSGAEFFHHITSALDLALADREAYFGDPDYVAVPWSELTSERHISERAASISNTMAFGKLPEPSSLSAYGMSSRSATESVSLGYHHQGALPPSLDTSVVTVIDGAGNVFAATPSDGVIDGPVVESLGFVVSTRGAQSHTEQHHPALAAPGRRPRVSANPLLYVSDTGHVTAGGGPGGDRQLSVMAQVLARYLFANEDLQSAISSPRVFSLSAPQSISPHSKFDGGLMLEACLDSDTAKSLEVLGYKTKVVQDWDTGCPLVYLVTNEASSPRSFFDPRAT